MNRKYKLSDVTKEIDGITVHRIVALKSFGGVSKGSFGGWVESEENLSQDGDAWVYNNACVMGKAVVKDDARVYGNARVEGDACISDNARVAGRALVGGYARIAGWACVEGYAEVTGEVQLEGQAHIDGNVCLSGPRQMIHIAGMMGPITVTDLYILIGNKQYTFEKWMELLSAEKDGDHACDYDEDEEDENGFTEADRATLRALLPVLFAEVKRHCPKRYVAIENENGSTEFVEYQPV